MREDWLERAVAAAERPLPDDGFTLRVMAALPPAPARGIGNRADWILIGATGVGSAIAASQFPLLPFARVLFESAQVVPLGAALMIGCMAAALFFEPLRRAL